MFCRLDRRSVVIALAAMRIGSSATAKHHKKKHKMRKERKKSPCNKRYPHRCGAYCCIDLLSACCDYPLDPGGKDCYDRTSHCCLAEFGGGACTPNETCCPAQKGGLAASCANVPLGQHCCPGESGGFCTIEKEWSAPFLPDRSLGQLSANPLNPERRSSSPVGGPAEQPCDHGLRVHAPTEGANVMTPF